MLPSANTHSSVLSGRPIYVNSLRTAPNCGFSLPETNLAELPPNLPAYPWVVESARLVKAFGFEEIYIKSSYR